MPRQLCAGGAHAGLIVGAVAIALLDRGARVAATLALGAVVTLVLGLLGSLPALAARPARALRSL